MKPFTPWPERIVRQNTCLNTVPCAVLVPVIHKDGEEHLVFEVRSSKLDWQPGEICFPGGRIDKTDASPLAAACGKRGRTGCQCRPHPPLGAFGLPGIACRRDCLALCRLYGHDGLYLERW